MTEPSSSAPRPTPAGSAISSRVRLAAVAALLATFVAGAAVGVGLNQWRHRTDDGRVGRGHGGGGPRGFLAPLDLSTAQRATVDSILERHRGELDRFWAGPGQQLRVIVDSTRNEIRAVLTPTQRAKYDSMLTERRRREHEREVGGGPIGPPPPGPRPD